jgi:hypothetical protein
MADSLADRLDDVTWMESRIKSLREAAFEREKEAHEDRAKADALELELVEQRTAANILRDVGLTVGRDEKGVPWVKVEKLPQSNPPAATEELR